MNEVNTGNPLSGWYPDPEGRPELRWWDGAAWTSQFQEAPSGQFLAPPVFGPPTIAPPPNVFGYPALEAVPQAPPTGWYAADPYRLDHGDADRQVEKNTPATLSLIFGIISVVLNPLLLMGIAALILGIVGIRRSGRSPFVGKGKAIAGLILSVPGFMVGIIILVIVLGGGGTASG